MQMEEERSSHPRSQGGLITILTTRGRPALGAPGLQPLLQPHAQQRPHPPLPPHAPPSRSPTLSWHPRFRPQPGGLVEALVEEEQLVAQQPEARQ